MKINEPKSRIVSKLKKLFLPGAILLVIVALLYGAWLFANDKTFFSSNDSTKTTMKAFVLSTGAYKPIENGKKVDTLNATVGDQVTAQMRYETKKVSSITVDLRETEDNIILKLGTFKVGDNGEFNLSFSTTNVKPNTYKIYVKNDSAQAQALGTINLSASAGKNN